MARGVIAALAIVSFLFSTPQAFAQDAANSIVGVWKMTSWSRKEVETGKVEQLMGANPSGLVIYTRGGAVSSFVTAEDRKASGTPPMKDEDRIALFSTMYAYSGSYTVEGRKLTTRIENSWNKAWNGNVITGEMEISGKKLTTTSAPTAAAKDGRSVIFIHTFDRVE